MSPVRLHDIGSILAIRADSLLRRCGLAEQRGVLTRKLMTWEEIV